MTHQYKWPEKIVSEIFRTYDIRGKVGDQLTPNLVYAVGHALAVEILKAGESKVVVGRDGRESSPELQKALIAGLNEGGCEIIDIGLVPTPVLYFATHYCEIPSGIMITGSHNPADYNGIKMVVAGETLSSERVQVLREFIEKNTAPIAKDPLAKVEDRPGLIEAYVNDVAQRIKLPRPLKIVIDCGNGAAAVVAPQLYRALGCEVVSLYDTIDGTFPNHHPDPADPANLVDIIERVKSEGADLGLAFDGDADRIGMITNKGEIIWPDRQMMVFAKDVLSRQPGAEIVFDVKCSRFLAQVIEQAGGVPLMWKTGHSLLKAKLRERKAALAGEMSGHIFFVENWYGFDDGMYAGARLLQCFAAQSESSSAWMATFPDSVSTPELKVAVAEEQKSSIMQSILEKADFPDGDILTLDGLRVDFPYGFLLVRPSNTTAYLTVRFEADTEQRLQELQKRFRDLMHEVDPALQCDF